MLKEYLKKVFNTAQAETQEEVISMTQENDQAALVTDTTTAELTAQLSTVTESLTTLQAAFADLQTKHAEAEAALAASAAAQEMLVAQAAAKVQAARTEKLVAIMGDAKGPQTAASLSALNDEAFDVVLASYAANFEAEAKSEMFSEKGVAAEAAPVVEETDAASRLAANLAAQFNQK